MALIYKGYPMKTAWLVINTVGNVTYVNTLICYGEETVWSNVLKVPIVIMEETTHIISSVLKNVRRILMLIIQIY